LGTLGLISLVGVGLGGGNFARFPIGGFCSGSLRSRWVVNRLFFVIACRGLVSRGRLASFAGRIQGRGRRWASFRCRARRFTCLRRGAQQDVQHHVQREKKRRSEEKNEESSFHEKATARDGGGDVAGSKPGSMNRRILPDPTRCEKERPRPRGRFSTVISETIGTA
jgi:hypothetical protein